MRYWLQTIFGLALTALTASCVLMTMPGVGS
jgi:hypothetical protein